MILDGGDAGGGPGRRLRLVALRPGADVAAEDDAAVGRIDRQPAGLDVGAAPEGLLDPLLDVGGAE